MVSSLTDNQIVAAVGSFGALLMLWIIDWMAESATIPLGALMNKLTLGLWDKAHFGLGGPTLGDFLGSLSLIQHFQDFRKGLIDTQHVVFYLSVVFMALFITQRVLESRRWR
jgi:ABC-2 type transport system permease protein